MTSSHVAVLKQVIVYIDTYFLFLISKERYAMTLLKNIDGAAIN